MDTQGAMARGPLPCPTQRVPPAQAKCEQRRVVAQGDRLRRAEGSPAASARAAAVIRECIGIPPHL